MELSGAGYSHSSLLVDIPINVNQQSAQQLIASLVASATTATTDEMRAYVRGENAVWQSPKALIRTLNLPNFNPHKWAATSRREYSTESQRANQTPLYEVLLLYMIQYTAGVKADASSAVLFLGDYAEILKTVEVVINPDFQHRFLEWKAFVPDPYNPNHVNLSEIYPLYDQYVNDKWLVGPDGSGSPSQVNLQWLQAQVATAVKPRLLLAANRRLDYFDDYLEALHQQYRSCLAVLAACEAGSTATFKTTLPTNNGVYGLYSLFSLFFARVRLVKTRHSTPDDTTAFLIGIDARPVTPEVLNTLLSDENAAVKILAILASNTNRQVDNELNRIIKETAEIHIDALFRL